MRSPSTHRQHGSAYVIALLALVVLTVLGLALALVTQSELQLGGNERIITRVMYAADSGVASSIARALTDADFGAKTFRMPDPVRTGSLALVNEVEVSPFYPVYDAPCNLCEINNAGTYANKAYRKVGHVVTTRATRRGVSLGTDLLADKTITVMVDNEPAVAQTAAFRPINDPTELLKIKM